MRLARPDHPRGTTGAFDGQLLPVPPTGSAAAVVLGSEHGAVGGQRACLELQVGQVRQVLLVAALEEAEQAQGHGEGAPHARPVELLKGFLGQDQVFADEGSMPG